MCKKSYPRSMRSSGASLREGWAEAMGTNRDHWPNGLEESSMVPISFKARPTFFTGIKPLRLILGAPREPTGEKWNAFGRISVAFYAGFPVERRNWMDNPKPEFLWVFRADKTPLLHKHSPSCSNRFVNLILMHFSVPILEPTSLSFSYCQPLVCYCLAFWCLAHNCMVTLNIGIV